MSKEIRPNILRIVYKEPSARPVIPVPSRKNEEHEDEITKIVRKFYKDYCKLPERDASIATDSAMQNPNAVASILEINSLLSKPEEA
jgi:hypothetical protein